MSGASISLDDMVCFPLYAATRAVTRTYADLLAEAGLTYPQYLTMLALWEADGPRSVRELGDRLMLDSGTLTPLLKRLEASGLVERRRDEVDERRVLISPTAAGESLQATVAEVPARLFAALGMSVPELVELRGRLNALLANLGQAAAAGGEVSPGGPAS